jgi:hypothetical protein
MNDKVNEIIAALSAKEMALPPILAMNSATLDMLMKPPISFEEIEGLNKMHEQQFAIADMGLNKSIASVSGLLAHASVVSSPLSEAVLKSQLAGIMDTMSLIRPAVALAAETVLQIPKLFAHIESASRMMPSLFETAYTLSEQMPGIMSTLLKGIDLSIVERIGGADDNLQQSFDKCNVRLVKHGWLILFDVSMDVIHEINSIPEDRLQKDIQEVFFALIDDENFYLLELLDSQIPKSRSMKNHYRIVKSAFDLYRKSGVKGIKNYHNLVVPSLLPVIDSAFTRLTRLKYKKEKEYRALLQAESEMVKQNAKKVSVNGTIYRYNDVLKADKEWRVRLNSKAKSEGGWLGASELLSEVFDDNLLGPTGLNRNGILHGRNTQYGSRANSARLLLLLGFLLELEGEIESL